VPRLLVHVEGETEEVFVNEVLRERLLASGYERVGARLLGNARQRDRRGGIRGWDTVRRDIIRHLTEDPGCIATTMIDYYGLPTSGGKAWPGRAYATSVPVANKGPHVEAALLDDLANHMEPGFDRRRFLPFVVMHEFEGLLFSDCAAFARGVGQGALANSLQEIRDQFDTPEDINDSPITAPSKRVEALIPGYMKPLLGNLAALEIGLETITTACPHFRTWRAELEARASLELG
jgi:hypothetical protein